MEDLELIKAELIVIYKRLDDLEHRVKGGSRMASLKTYADELEREAQKVLSQIR